MKSNARPGRPAFTLIELLAVITIIVILASLVVAGLSFVTERQAREKARVQIALISKALEDYKLDMGSYPLLGTAPGTDPTGNTASCIYIPLFYEGYDYNRQTTPPTSWTKTIGSGTTSITIPKSTRIYLPALDPTTTKQGWVDLVTGATPTPPTSTTVKDPWGNEYRYRPGKNTAGTDNPNSINPDFDLWSAGKDGKTNGATSAAGAKDPLNRDDVGHP